MVPEVEPFGARFVLLPPPLPLPPLELVKRYCVVSELSPVLSSVEEECFFSEEADVSDSGGGEVLVLRTSPCRTLLFSAGQPLQLDVPPVPSHRPSPGHVPPLGCCS